ncbi:RHS repeat-associated core domain-containing protein [Pseudomonas sp. SWRI100]|nr:RHS repeat-associated core domain-containing protein [Pseudomonas sp. SWRI67]MBV4524814.1 RHS repeat-associated core domain-containing protein [Pseudomonas kermanshahensis]
MGILSITTMKTFTGAWFFYEGDAVRTVWQEGRCSSLIQAAGMRLVERKVANGLQQTMMLASDGMGSVIGESGTRSKSVAYSPYGFQRGMESLIGFAGQMQSLLPIGYFLGNGYRFFDVVTNRFNSPDEFSPFGRGGVNAYVYCGGDPVNRTDPSGHMIYYVGSSSVFNWLTPGTELSAPIAPIAPSARTGPSYYSDGLFGKSQVQNFPRITTTISPRSEGIHASRKRAASTVEAGGAKRVKQEGGLIQKPQADVNRRQVKARMTARIEYSQLELFSNDSNVPDNRTIALDYLDMLDSKAADEAREALYNKYGRTVRVIEVREYVYNGVSGIVSWIRRSAKR